MNTTSEAQERKDAYKDYLRSSWWRERRQAYLKKHPRCERCNSGSQPQIHHQIYYRDGISILFREEDCDLETLCKQCHKAHHNRKDGGKQRAPKREKRKRKSNVIQLARFPIDDRNKKEKRRKNRRRDISAKPSGAIWELRDRPPARIRNQRV